MDAEQVARARAEEALTDVAEFLRWLLSSGEPWRTKAEFMLNDVERVRGATPNPKEADPFDCPHDVDGSGPCRSCLAVSSQEPTP